MKRYLPYVLVALVLLALNVLKWVGPNEAAGAAAPSAAARGLEPRDFELRVSLQVPREEGAVRDLFFAPPVARPARVNRPAQPPGPPPKTPEELAAEEAQAELSRLGVTGIALRNGKGQAYITRGAESFVVKAGDTISERFEVTSISADYVSVRDTRTGIERRIALQGE